MANIESVTLGHRLAGMCIVLSLTGQVALGETSQPVMISLWQGQPPGFIPDTGPEEMDDTGNVGNVSVPGIAVYLPLSEQATGDAIIVCPGGSYSRVGDFTTGMGAIDLFLSRGIAVVVLKYRTRPPSKDVQRDALTDAKRAVRLVRYHAKDWRIDPQRIGMLGSSAGSHLVLNLATHSDRGEPDASDPVERESCRPDFLALLSLWPSDETVEDFPIEEDTPPAFICSARDDEIAPTAFAESVAKAYDEVGASAKLWTIDHGGHSAFTIGGRGPGAKWVEQYCSWFTSEH